MKPNWEIGDKIRDLAKEKDRGFYRISYGFKDKTNFVMLAATTEDADKLEQLKKLEAEWYGEE